MLSVTCKEPGLVPRAAFVCVPLCGLFLPGRGRQEAQAEQAASSCLKQQQKIQNQRCKEEKKKWTDGKGKKKTLNICGLESDSGSISRCRSSTCLCWAFNGLV